MKEKTNTKATAKVTTTRKAVKTTATNKANAELAKHLAKLTRPELSARHKANVEERKRLSAENKLLVELWKKLGNKK
jgi:hypothetical protein